MATDVRRIVRLNKDGLDTDPSLTTTFHSVAMELSHRKSNVTTETTFQVTDATGV